MKKLPIVIIGILSIVSSLSVATVFTLQATGVISVLAEKVNVEFRNYDNSLLYKGVVPAGTNVDYEGSTPVRASTDEYDYTFVGWDKSLYNITKDTIYHAQFQNTPRQYKVTFQNYNQKELYSTYVVKGQNAVYIGQTPTRPSDERYSYTFSGWDKDLSNILEDTMFTAQYEESIVNYKVTFLNYNGDFLFADYVVAGEDAVYGGIKPARPGTKQYDYEFIGWDRTLSNVTCDFETVAVFEEKETKYKVDFYNYDNTYLYTDYVSYNGTAVYSAKTPSRPDEGEFTYTFSGWNKALTNIVVDTTVIAQYEAAKRTFTVEFYNYDGTYLYTASAEYHRPAFYNGPTPTKPDDVQYSYTFDSWDRDLSSIEENVITYATFSKTLRKYRCIYKNYNGELLETYDVEYGSTSVYTGPTPTKSDDDGVTFWKFIGWDKDEHNITGDTIFTAQYEAIEGGGGGASPKVHVLFENYDGTILDADIVDKPNIYYYEDTPTREGTYKGCNYEFCGWSQETINFELKENVLFAQYEINTYPNKTYIVTYRGYDGELLYEDYVHYGESSSYNGPIYDYLSPSYGFSGWDKPLDYITQSITVFPLTGEVI